MRDTSVKFNGFSMEILVPGKNLFIQEIFDLVKIILLLINGFNKFTRLSLKKRQ